jgi:type VII secretion-associated serine protease mycosin
MVSRAWVLLVMVVATALTPTDAAIAADRCAAAATTIVTAAPWAQQKLAPQRVWHLSRGDAVTVAVVSTGVDARVPQLRGHVLPGVDVTKPGGHADADCLGHGTFVAGLIAARVVPGVGFAGVAPGARILPIRSGPDGADIAPNAVAAAIRAAVHGGARVVDLMTGAVSVTPELRAAVKYAAQQDVLIVAPAADVAASEKTATYLSAQPGVLAVGAIARDGSQPSAPAPGVDLVAPGADLLSTGRGGAGHVVASDVSYAAPFVAGVAALVRAYHPRLTAEQVKRRLELTADRPGSEVPDPQVGWGVVDPYAAVVAVLPDEVRSGAGSVRPRVFAAPRRPAKDNRDRNTALLVATGSVLLAIVAGLTGLVISHGRRRGWEPAAHGESGAQCGHERRCCNEDTTHRH